jgi:hypothetical protein
LYCRGITPITRELLEHKFWEVEASKVVVTKAKEELVHNYKVINFQIGSL